jgi:acyl-CoA thioester hydrolase
MPGANHLHSLYLGVHYPPTIFVVTMHFAPSTARFMKTNMNYAVRAYDIDAMGIVSNIVYVRWFEDLRTAFLEKYHPLRDMLAAGITPILAHTDIHYRWPITIQDQPEGESWLESMGRSKWRMGFEIRVGGKVCCTGTQEGIFVDLATRRPAPAPEKLMAAYAEELKAAGGSM